ncbi:zinc-dependent metalloprotease [Halorussus salilacus]|uniref:zinc-dependent metalloprotease n=1 Tax=Halorussus salilacus TaxID=2953750 RepID=UPI00209D52D2|nr:zinc-dependent metalloprotease [Halorussus salilacus]USZ67732.1 zinc-dependent metalloprotease [Halorussus salilacus]
MNLYRSVRAIAESSGDGPIDWNAVAESAKAATDPGSIELSESERAGYASDVRDARARVREVSGTEFDVPRTVEVQNRHHWIDANIDTFRRVMEPIEEHGPTVLPGVARTINTGTMSLMLSVLAKNVLGQYDPLLLAEGDDHALYFVRPNIRRIADQLDVDYDRFRRWIAFHEVTHAAEFGAAPWLSEHLESRMEEGIEALAHGHLDREAFSDLDAAMTAVEGYAELLMDGAFDDEYADLREKMEARRRGQNPLSKLLRRLLGLGLKRRQYERGKAFFDAVAAERGIEGASAVWDRPENLPTDAELDEPSRWLARVRP